MASLTQTKCANHEDREAVARCPVCHLYFCRECVTEHEGRLVCADCLAVPEEAPRERSSLAALAGVGWFFKAAVGLMLAWIFFYTMGRILLRIPSSFHSGDFWGDL